MFDLQALMQDPAYIQGQLLFQNKDPSQALALSQAAKQREQEIQANDIALQNQVSGRQAFQNADFSRGITPEVLDAVRMSGDTDLFLKLQKFALESQKQNALIGVLGGQSPIDSPNLSPGIGMDAVSIPPKDNIDQQQARVDSLARQSILIPELKPYVESEQAKLERLYKNKDSAKGDVNKKFEQENALYKDFTKTTDKFLNVRDAYLNMEVAAKDDSGPGDIQMIFGFMKSQDPSSTVREGEFATAENAGGVSNQVQNLYNKVLQGERLTPELRAKFLGLGKKNYESALNQHRKIKSQFDKRAEQYGLNPKNVTFDLEAVHADEVPSGAAALKNMSDEEIMKTYNIKPEDLK